MGLGKSGRLKVAGTGVWVRWGTDGSDKYHNTSNAMIKSVNLML